MFYNEIGRSIAFDELFSRRHFQSVCEIMADLGTQWESLDPGEASAITRYIRDYFGPVTPDNYSDVRAALELVAEQYNRISAGLVQYVLASLFEGHEPMPKHAYLS